MRDPFAVFNQHNFSSDERSRIALFAFDLNLVQGDVITVQAEDAQHVIHQLPVEFAGAVPNLDGLWQIVVRLTDLAPADYLVRFTLRGTPSNQGIITIKPITKLLPVFKALYFVYPRTAPRLRFRF